MPVRQWPFSRTATDVLQARKGSITPLLEIDDTQRMEIVAELLTTDALAAQPGNRVMVERWGGPVALEGRVRSVEPAACQPMAQATLKPAP